MAAYDMGYDTAADEIDLLELHGEYPRGHLTRLVSLYTTGRSSFSVSYPDDPTALALPLDNGRSIRGEDISSSVWQSSPVPALLSFTVQPRSLAMFRSEQMMTLGGAVRLKAEGGERQIVNESGLELRDAVLIESTGPGKRRNRLLGTIKPADSVVIGPATEDDLPRVVSGPGPDAKPFLDVQRSTRGSHEEDQGELRLVAWISGTSPGQLIEPAIDRKRGFTAVLIHLRSGPPPSPDGRRYNLRAASGENAGQASIGPSEAASTDDASSIGPTPRRRQPASKGNRATR